VNVNADVAVVEACATVPQPGLGEHKADEPRGHVTDGCTAISAGAWMRGHSRRRHGRA
jgi:hypothetical protein